MREERKDEGEGIRGRGEGEEMREEGSGKDE